jgi:hypothetical protein
MKKSITLNGALKLSVLMLLSLWTGYAIGYHRGMRDDQREWWASVRLDSQGNRVFDGPQAVASFDPYFERQNPIPDKLGK